MRSPGRHRRFHTGSGGILHDGMRDICRGSRGAHRGRVRSNCWRRSGRCGCGTSHGCRRRSPECRGGIGSAGRSTPMSESNGKYRFRDDSRWVNWVVGFCRRKHSCSRRCLPLGWSRCFHDRRSGLSRCRVGRARQCWHRWASNRVGDSGCGGRSRCG